MSVLSPPVRRPWPAFWRRYEAGKWEPATKALLAESLSPDDLFCDIGAWIGPVTLWALELGAKVIAIEPDPVAAAELNRRAPAAEIWQGAVTADGAAAHLAPRFEWGDSMTRMSRDGLRVDGWALAEILDGRVPALVKMDVEGYELELLPTVAPMLAELGVPLQVALHDGLPDPEWFAGYRHVAMPSSARDERGRSNVVVAR